MRRTTNDGVQFWTLRKLFFFQNHRSCRSVAALRKLIRRPLFPPPLIECRGETNDTELSFESSLLGIRVTPLFPFSLISVFSLSFSLLSFSLTHSHSLASSFRHTRVLAVSREYIEFSRQHNQLCHTKKNLVKFLHFAIFPAHPV